MGIPQANFFIIEITILKLTLVQHFSENCSFSQKLKNRGDSNFYIVVQRRFWENKFLYRGYTVVFKERRKKEFHFLAADVFL